MERETEKAAEKDCRSEEHLTGPPTSVCRGFTKTYKHPARMEINVAQKWEPIVTVNNIVTVIYIII
jgi:hypothetical protein